MQALFVFRHSNTDFFFSCQAAVKIENAISGSNSINDLSYTVRTTEQILIQHYNIFGQKKQYLSDKIMKVSQTVPPTVQLHFNNHQHDQISSFETCFCAIRSKVSRTAPGCLLKSKTIWTIFKGHVQVITQRDKKQDRRNAPPFSIVGYNTCSSG